MQIESRMKDWKYNNIANWNWTSLLKAFGDLDKMRSNSYTVCTKAELSDLLNNGGFACACKMQVVEVIMDKLDAPRSLRLQAEASGKANSYETSSNSVVARVSPLQSLKDWQLPEPSPLWVTGHKAVMCYCLMGQVVQLGSSCAIPACSILGRYRYTQPLHKSSSHLTSIIKDKCCVDPQLQNWHLFPNFIIGTSG